MDNFKFVTQITNPVGKGPTMEEYVEKLLKQSQISEAAPEGDDGKPDKEKGQVINDGAEAGVAYQDGESVKGKNEGEKKTEVKESKKEEPKAEESEKEAATETPVKEAAGKAKAEDCKDEGIPVSLDADEEFQKGESPAASKVDAKNKKTEASTSRWVKISNLNEKEKKMLKSYWSVLYPREYVDSMVADR